MKDSGRRWERMLRGLLGLILGRDFPPELVRRVQDACEYRTRHGVSGLFAFGDQPEGAHAVASYFREKIEVVREQYTL